MMGSPKLLTIMFVSHTDAFGTFRVGSHHLARELSRLGHRVLHVSTPVSLAHRATGRGEATRELASRRGPITDGDGVTHLVPRTILPAGASTLPYRRIVSEVFGTPSVDVVFIDQPTLWSRQLREVADTLVYRPTDLYESGSKARFQRSILSASDAVVATSSEVLRELRKATDVPTLTLRNGVELERFAPPSPPLDREMRAVYVGALDSRFDWDAVVTIADTDPSWAIDIYGPGEPPTKTLPSNLHLRGVAPYGDLPVILRGAKVGLLPLSDSPVNRGRSPMKLYEYLASGLSVVSRETPVIQDQPDIGLFTYSSGQLAGDAFAAAVRSPVPNSAGETAAAQQGWAEKAHDLLAFAQSHMVRDLKAGRS